MDIKLFDNRILAPSKCGTRYLRKVYSDKRFDINVDNINNITHIIVRNPYEHFESALHTEYINYKTTNDTMDGVHHIMDGVITSNGIGHWHPQLYRFLYSIFNKNKSIKVIDLSKLSSFLKSEGYDMMYDKSEYDWSSFSHWKSKEEVISDLKIEFKNEFKIIEDKLQSELIYYNKLVNMQVLNEIL